MADRFVGADRERLTALVLGEIKGDHRGVAHQAQIRDRVLAQPTRTDHEGPPSLAGSVQDVEAMAHGPVGGESAARERATSTDQDRRVERGSGGP